MGEQFIMSMGERIAEGRKILNLTQEKVAEYANVTKQTIQSAEKGQKELKSKSIVGIATALQMSTDYLLNGTRTEYDLHLLDKQALELTDEQFDFLKKFYIEFLEFCRKGEME